MAQPTYDLKTAAALFGLGHIEFYKILRGESEQIPLQPSWIHAGTFKNDPAKNAPKEWARKAGFLRTETRGRPSNYNNLVTELYAVTVITQHGITTMELILGKKATAPTPQPLTEQNARAVAHQQPSQAALIEREKCLRELAAMGIPINKAS